MGLAGRFVWTSRALTGIRLFATQPRPPMSSPTILLLSETGIVADEKTDQREALQPLFDRARSGQPVEIVNDLGGVLVTSGNDVWPNTTVRTLLGGTWRLAPGSRRGILRNKHPLASWPAGALRQDGTRCEGPTPPDDAHPADEDGRGDFNISLVGGRYDGNRRSGGWPNNGRTPNSDAPVLDRDNRMVSALQFYGVKNLSLRGVRIYDSPTLSLHVGNVINVVVEDCALECPAVIYNSNTDGFHINGPADNIWVSNFYCRQMGDDAVSIMSDDSMESTTEGNQAAYFGMSAGWGPVTRVRIRGLVLDRCSSGIRFLTATQRIDDVIISDVQGTCMGPCLLIDKYLFLHDRGNIGRLTLENIRLTTLGLDYDGEAGGMTRPSAPPGPVLWCNTNIESLVLRNISHESANASPWGLFLPCRVRMLTLDGLTCHDDQAANDGMNLLFLTEGAALDSVCLSNVHWPSTHPQGGALVHNKGAIDRLAASNLLLPPDAQAVGGTPPHSAQLPGDG